jgi:hypothetical protein
VIHPVNRQRNRKEGAVLAGRGKRNKKEVKREKDKHMDMAEAKAQGEVAIKRATCRNRLRKEYRDIGEGIEKKVKGEREWFLRKVRNRQDL